MKMRKRVSPHIPKSFNTTPAELKALGVFLAAIADEPVPIKTSIGGFQVQLTVTEERAVTCSTCHHEMWLAAAPYKFTGVPCANCGSYIHADPEPAAPIEAPYSGITSPESR